MSTDRTTLIQGLRYLADILDTNADLPLPHEVTVGNLCFFVHRDLEQALKLRALMANPVTKHATNAAFPVDITGTLYGLPVRVYVGAEVALADSARGQQSWPACDPRLGLDVGPDVHTLTFAVPPNVVLGGES